MTRDEAAEKIAAAAEEFAFKHTPFKGGCSEMVRAAYAAGGIEIHGDANHIIRHYPCVSSPKRGDIAGWWASHGPVVISFDQGSHRVLRKKSSPHARAAWPPSSHPVLREISPPHGHVVIFLGPHHWANCPGEGQPTQENVVSMGHSLTYVRP